MQWEMLYAELSNKIRWAIGTSVGATGSFNLSYREQQDIAHVLAGDLLACLKAKDETPDLDLVMALKAQMNLNGKKAKKTVA